MDNKPVETSYTPDIANPPLGAPTQQSFATIPQNGIFSRLKDPFSGLSHLAAAIFFLIGSAWLTLSALIAGRPMHALGFGLFGLGLVLLYSASATYHLLRVSPAVERWLRRADHMMIYILIAGSYTPFCLVVLPGAWGPALLIAIWSFAVAGILLKSFYLEAPRWLTVGIYIVMGWLCIAAIQPLVQGLTTSSLVWLVLGGLAYTGGAVIYALKRPNPLPGVFGFHEIWHLFVITGSLCHFISMMYL